MERFEPVEAVVLTADRAVAQTVVHVAGEIDVLTAPSVEEYVLARLDEKPGTLVLHLGAVTFFGSAGLNALLMLHDECSRRRIGFRLGACSAAVLRSLELTNLVSFFESENDTNTV